MSVNVVHLIGRLGKDPDLKYNAGGSAICKFSLAISKKFKDKNGNQQEKTDWINIVIFGKSAEHCSKYLQKGSQVYLSGSLSVRAYEKDGIMMWMTEVVANNVQFLSKKEPSTNSAPKITYENNNDNFDKPSYNQDTSFSGNFTTDDLPF